MSKFLSEKKDYLKFAEIYAITTVRQWWTLTAICHEIGCELHNRMAAEKMPVGNTIGRDKWRQVFEKFKLLNISDAAILAELRAM